jgi:hypothetical protein
MGGSREGLVLLGGNQDRRWGPVRQRLARQVWNIYMWVEKNAIQPGCGGHPIDIIKSIRC